MKKLLIILLLIPVLIQAQSYRPLAINTQTGDTIWVNSVQDSAFRKSGNAFIFFYKPNFKLLNPSFASGTVGQLLVKKSSADFDWAWENFDCPTPSFSSITGQPTDNTNLAAALSGKQATLVSGTNLKTVNGNSLLGSGDVPISSSASWGSITGTLSNQTDLNSALAGKQASLGYTPLNPANNLSEVTASTARTNLGIGNIDNTSDATKNAATATFTNKTFNLSSNTLTGTKAQFNAALSDGDFATQAGTETITNKDLSSGNTFPSKNINGAAFNFTADIQTQAEILAYQTGGSPILAESLNFPLFICNTATALVNNTVRFQSVWLPKAATLTGIRVYVRTAGSYTANNNNRVGLYTYSGGTLTLVASSANSGTLWTSAANAFQTIPFSSTYNAAAGLYFVGLLYNNSAQTTAPALAGGAALNNVAMATMLGTNSIKFLGTIGTQNDLPSSQAMSGVTGSTASYWIALY